MGFWAYMIQCADRRFYTGHTEDLDERIGQHQAGTVRGYTSTRRPVHLVWAEEFPSRYEALVAERRIKGWSRAKKLALIRGDWAAISALARSSQEGRTSTGSARTVFGNGAKPLFLHPHQASLPSEPFSLEATLGIEPTGLTCRFRLFGPMDILRIPPPGGGVRRDGLWKSTCFEAFLQTAFGYLEFNLSASSDWAAYSFAGYRAGMDVLDVPPPIIRTGRKERALTLTARIALPPDARPTRLGLAAVIEELSGRKSYWALRHPPGDVPDFHHPDCFAIDLSPPPDG